MTIAITVEGVLRKIEGGAPIKPGIDLYYGLATRAKLVLLSDEIRQVAVGVTNDGQMYPDDRESELEHWLKMEGMREHQRTVYTSALISMEREATRRVCQVNEARRWGHDVTLVIEPNPRVSAALIEAGYNTLTFSHAEYAVPSWRPDYKLKPAPWDELVARLDHEAHLRATDTRKEEL